MSDFLGGGGVEEEKNIALIYEFLANARNRKVLPVAQWMSEGV